MLLHAGNLAFDKLRLSVCRFLQAGGQGELSRVFKVEVDLRAASKNKPNARSAWSTVFSASSRSSAGTSNLGSVIIVPVVR